MQRVTMKFLLLSEYKTKVLLTVTMWKDLAFIFQEFFITLHIPQNLGTPGFLPPSAYKKSVNSIS